MEKEKIEFRKRREFGEKLNSVFDFIRQEFRPLMKGLIYIAGPVIAIASLIGAYFQRWSLSMMDFSFEDPDVFFSDDLWTSVVGLMIFSLTAYVFIFAVVNEYVKEYIKAGNTSIEVKQLWSSVKENLGNYALSVIVYGILTFGFFFFSALLISLLASLGGAFVMMFIFIGFFILIFMLLAVIYLLPIVYNSESEGIFSTIGRTVELLRGKWLSTIGLLIVVAIIVSVASIILAVPSYMITGMSFLQGMQFDTVSSMSFTQSLSYGIANFIASAGNYLLSIIPMLALIFQYYNLVERRDASGLMQRIDQMGSGEDEDADETF